MKPQHILYVYSGKARPNAGGLDLVVRQQLLALVDAGYRVTFLSRGRYNHPLVRNICIPVTPAHVFSSLPSQYYYYAQHRFFSYLGGILIRLFRFDATISWARQSLELFKVANRRGIPAILNCPIAHYKSEKRSTPYTDYCWPYAGLDDFEEELSRASLLLTASEVSSISFARYGCQDKHIISIGRGTDIERFLSKPRTASPFRAIFFGRVCDRKGILQALDGWRKADIENGELWIVGSMDEEIRSEVEARLPQNAKLLGHSRTPEQLLSQCHVQILPSRREGMAKSLIEGAACGLVTLSTQESGFPVVEGVTGFYIERDDTEAIARHLRMLAADSVVLSQMMEASSLYVQQNLTWDRFRMQFIAAIQPCLLPETS